MSLQRGSENLDGANPEETSFKQLQGGSNMTGTDLYDCAAAVRP